MKRTEGYKKMPACQSGSWGVTQEKISAEISNKIKTNYSYKYNALPYGR